MRRLLWLFATKGRQGLSPCRTKYFKCRGAASAGKFALENGVRAAGQENIGIGRGRHNIHIQDAAVRHHSGMLTGYKAAQRQRGNRRARAGAAGEGKILYAALEGQQAELILSHELIQIHVRAPRKNRVMPQGARQFAQRVPVL